MTISLTKEIVKNNVKPVCTNSVIDFVIYYKNSKTSNLILKNSPSCSQDVLKKRNVVYHFKCQEVGCTHEYIGMTTMRLSKRISCHMQEGAIYQHYVNNHNHPPIRNNVLNSFTIAAISADQRRLRLLEALKILELKPSLNCTQEPLLLPTMTPPVPRLIN